jgi:hypothetical protein
MRVVPDTVLCGVNNEAPPGSFFSGKTIRNSTQWTPAPEGKVWYEHPNLTGSPKYVSDVQYWYLKRQLELCPGFALDINREINLFEESGRYKFWCPVKLKFMSEGEMLRQEHWFCNGNGSAQQRRYYTQNEMLDRHGGLSTLPAGYDDTGKQLGASHDSTLRVTGVRTSNQIIDAKFKQAEETGSILDLT